MPKAPIVTEVVPTGERSGQTWRYTTSSPAQGWEQPDFDDSNWKQGQSGFGTRGTPSARVRTEWNSPNIWLRREFELPDIAGQEVQFFIHHDEDADVYLNGVLALQRSGFTTAYETVPLTPGARTALKTGANTIAVHCRQTGGGQYIDVGLVTVKEVR